MPEAGARKVMQIFRMFQVEPETMLMSGSIIAKAPQVGLDYEDIDAAVNEAIARGWLRRGEGPMMLFLTKEGANIR